MILRTLPETHCVGPGGYLHIDTPTSRLEATSVTHRWWGRSTWTKAPSTSLYAGRMSGHDA